ncbi:MAG TPA: hypothetical protein VFG51_03620 [Candidatus Saccharimonadia bacterium]|nr:hypothetical protein [Candidatus Saccharimonadia bacterium]
MVAATIESSRMIGTTTEQLPRSQASLGLLTQAFLKFVTNIKEVATRLPRKIAYEVENADRKPNIYDFNTFLLTQRFHEFFKEFLDRDDAMAAFLQLARKDFRTWADEYVLHKNVASFSYDVETSPEGEIALKTPEYRKITLIKMAENAVHLFSRMGEPTTRLEADTASIARLMEWANRPQAKEGDVAFSVSPFDSGNKFYQNYSFIFKRELRIREDGTRQIVTTQYKSWHSHEHLVEILGKLGCRINSATHWNDRTIAASFFPTQKNASDTEVFQMLALFPNRKPILPEFQEIQPKSPDQFGVVMQTAETFVMRVIEEQYGWLLKNPTPQNEILVSRIIEETVGSYAKRYLTERAREDQAGRHNYAFEQKSSLEQLYKTSMAYIRHRYFHQKLDKTEAATLQSNMKDVFGYLGPIMSAGQCWGGALSEMFLSSGDAASNALRGITPELLGTHITNQHRENCPNCGKGVKVFDLANGDVWCPGCKQVKLCGKNDHRFPHSKPASRTSRQNLEQRQPVQQSSNKASREKRQIDEPITSPGDFFGSMFTNMLTGNTIRS